MEGYVHHEIVVIGGGICGLATALAFHRKGIRCTVLERSETLRAAGAAIIMMPNGWRALDHLGVGGELRQTAMLIERSYRIFVHDSKRVKLPVGDDEIRCLKRQDLVRVLADNLPKGTIHFGCRIVSLKIDEKSSSILHLDDGRVLTAKVVIGCDGVHSIVSDALGLNPMKVKNTCVTRGFTYYPNGHSLPPEFPLYTSAQGQFGYLPITNNSVYWFVTRMKTPQDSHIKGDKPRALDAALDFVKGYDQKSIEMVKNTDLEIMHVTTNLRLRSPFDLLTNSFRRGTVTVAGDALHAVGPFLAQGGSLALEDAVVLARCVASSISIGFNDPLLEKGIGVSLERYFQARKMRVFWLMFYSFLRGNIAGTISSRVVKYLSIVLLSLLFSKDPSSHTRFDCGPL